MATRTMEPSTNADGGFASPGPAAPAPRPTLLPALRLAGVAILVPAVFLLSPPPRTAAARRVETKRPAQRSRRPGAHWRGEGETSQRSVKREAHWLIRVRKCRRGGEKVRGGSDVGGRGRKR